ncbi:unnamed protein product [Spirodela intermedia]|uniref:Uncharacterized protein n=1 Tax=Spirodela intermedia TaxID=51605 RepID=A0A7I8JT65_SPIIN|nr:unnamed protein product [Spirodela intermedia]CAA6672622.1 unnamed protein product [Spirodela intermedia]
MRIRCRSPPARDAGGEETESGSTVSSAQSSSATVPKKKRLGGAGRLRSREGVQVRPLRQDLLHRNGSRRPHEEPQRGGGAGQAGEKKVPLAPERTAEEGDSVVLHGGGSEKLEGGWPAEGRRRGQGEGGAPGHWGSLEWPSAATGRALGTPPLHCSSTSTLLLRRAETRKKKGTSDDGGDVRNHRKSPLNPAAGLQLDLNSPLPAK